MTLSQNKTAQTVPQAFKKAVATYGNRVAMRHKEFGLWHDISWMQYYRRVRYVGAALISMGLKKGDCVSIIGDNCPEWVFTSMGVQCAGGVAVGRLCHQCLAPGGICRRPIRIQFFSSWKMRSSSTNG